MNRFNIWVKVLFLQVHPVKILNFFLISPKHLGVTPPIALNYPTQREIEVTDLLVQELTAQGTFESEDESRRR